jgi:hypothetical protein
MPTSLDGEFMAGTLDKQYAVDLESKRKGVILSLDCLDEMKRRLGQNGEL